MRISGGSDDTIIPDGTTTKFLSMPRYTAPEIIAGGDSVFPNALSDRYSLAIILFMILFMNHPFEGKKVCACDSGILCRAILRKSF